MDKEQPERKYIQNVTQNLKDYILLTGGNNRFIDLKMLLKDLEKAEKNQKNKEDKIKKSMSEIINVLDDLINKPTEDNATMLLCVKSEIETLIIQLSSDK